MVKFTVSTRPVILEARPRARKIPPKNSTQAMKTAICAGIGKPRVETEDGVLVIRRIHVAMHLVAAEAARETAERAHGFYAMRCPLYRTLHKAILLTSSFELRAPASNS